MPPPRTCAFISFGTSVIFVSPFLPSGNLSLMGELMRGMESWFAGKTPRFLNNRVCRYQVIRKIGVCYPIFWVLYEFAAHRFS